MSPAEDVELSSLRAPWGVRDVVYAMLAAVGLVLLGLGIRLGATWLGLGELSPGGRILAAFALEAMLVIPAWILGPRKYGGGWAVLGLRPFPFGRSAALASASLAFIMVVNAIWELQRRRLGWPGQPSYLPLFGEGLRGLGLALFLGAGVAPVAEEILFRGYLFAGLRARLGLGWALVASAAVFSLAHLVPGVLPPIFFTGIVLAVVFEGSNSLWPCIAVHSTLNALAFIAVYLAQRLPT